MPCSQARRGWQVLACNADRTRADAVKRTTGRRVCYLLAKPINWNHGAERKVLPAALELKPWQETRLCATAKIAGRCY